jgi:acyl carrier protein
MTGAYALVEAIAARLSEKEQLPISSIQELHADLGADSVRAVVS